MKQDYRQLYEELLKKYKKLQVELSETKKVLETYTGEPSDIEVQEAYEAHNKSNTELAEFFMSLFQGRSDVYAKRYYNQNTDKAGYVPQCYNEWQQGICDKKKHKCHSCPHRKFKPLTPHIIERHLHGQDHQGRDVIGIYPILLDETCHFLAVDFDKENWQKDVTAFRKTCGERGVPVYIERSRSGNGAHAWLFFSEKIPIKLARKFGNTLLTLTMESHSHLTLASYDRLFPNQDYMPKGGFGNLIALPLQGKAVRENNSLFIDENFMPFSNQWQILENVEKLSLRDIKKICDDHQDHGELGKLMDVSIEGKPWEQKQLSLSLGKADFPQNLKLILANRVYVHQDGISSRGINELKRLAAFDNPKFYEKQRARISTHNEPRIIDCSKIEKGYLSLPRGTLESLKDLLNGINVNYEVDDKRFSGIPLAVTFDGTLRDQQEKAVVDLMAHEIGVLSATTAFGKTVTASNLIASRKVNTLVLVHTTTLMKQWQTSLENFLTSEEALPPQSKSRGRKKKISHIGILGGSKNTLGGRVDVVTMQSLIKGDKVKELVAEYGMVIVDECHHVGAYGYEMIMSAVRAKYVYGLTATPERQDGRHPIVFMQCGPIRHYVSAKEQAKKRDFNHAFITRFTTLKKPEQLDEDSFQIADAYKLIDESEERNLRIVRDVAEAIEAGRNPIILTNRTIHVEILEKLLTKYVNCEIVVLIGKGTAKQKREQLERLHGLPPDTQCVVVATGKYVGEGFDFPRLDTLFLAMPVSWSGILHQYAGRLHREYEGKQEVIIYDYVDIHIRMLEKMYHKRVKGYAKLGYLAKTDYNTHEDVGVLFNENDFLIPLKKDMNDARLSIIIASPILRNTRVISMMSYLQGLPLEIENITIITNPMNSYKENEQEKVQGLLGQLSVAGFIVIERADLHQKFVVIDNQVVWYGSINLFGYGRSAENMLRFVSEEVASQMMNDVSDGRDEGFIPK